MSDARFRYLLQLADTSLVLGQRLGEWVGHAPALEEAFLPHAADIVAAVRGLI